MKIERKPFNVMLSEDEKATLEKVRRQGGYRSAGEAIRDLIEIAAPGKPIDFDRGIMRNAVVEMEFGEIRPITKSPPKGDPTPISPKAYADIQIGPTKRGPGALQKKGKAK